MILWQKMVMLYLAIAIGCAFWQPSVVFDNSNSMLNMFNINSKNWNSSSLSLSYSGDSNSPMGNVNSSIYGQATAQGNQPSTTSGTGTQFFLIDALFSVINLISLLFLVSFSPFLIMMAGQMPIEIIYFIGIPMIVMFTIGIIGFIRGTG